MSRDIHGGTIEKPLRRRPLREQRLHFVPERLSPAQALARNAESSCSLRISRRIVDILDAPPALGLMGMMVRYRDYRRQANTSGTELLQPLRSSAQAIIELFFTEITSRSALSQVTGTPCVSISFAACSCVMTSHAHSLEAFGQNSVGWNRVMHWLRVVSAFSCQGPEPLHFATTVV